MFVTVVINMKLHWLRLHPPEFLIALVTAGAARAHRLCLRRLGKVLAETAIGLAVDLRCQSVPGF